MKPKFTFSVTSLAIVTTGIAVGFGLVFSSFNHTIKIPSNTPGTKLVLDEANRVDVLELIGVPGSKGGGWNRLLEHVPVRSWQYLDEEKVYRVTLVIPLYEKYKVATSSGRFSLQRSRRNFR